MLKKLITNYSFESVLRLKIVKRCFHKTYNDCFQSEAKKGVFLCAEKKELFNFFRYINRKPIWLNYRLLCLYSKKVDNQIPSEEVLHLAEFIISKNPDSYQNEINNELLKVLNFLLSHGCNISDLKEMFSYSKDLSNFSYNKLLLLAEIDSNVSLLLPLLSLPLISLRSASNQAREDKSEIKNFQNRISYLCYHLELSVSELIPALAKHSALLTMKFKRLDQKMNTLKNAKINTEHIVKDLWIFNYNEKLLLARIQTAQNAGVELKPWMLRCSKKIFESMLTKVSETQRILHGEDEISYLAEKLDCTKEYVEYLMERNKLLKSINIPKLEQVINFLYEKGYTPQEVRLFPRVFCSSVQTLGKRFEKFRQLRSTLPTISQLCISSKNFEAYKKNA